jgi:PAS domain S-box-containing protein
MRQNKRPWRRTEARGFQQPGRERRADESTALIAVFDDIEDRVYIVDPDSYKILYANRIVKRDFGNNVVGKRCHEALQGSEKPCDFCTNRLIFGENLGKSYTWEFQNLKNKRWYRCIDKAIKWHDEKMVRYEMAIDIHDLKVAEDALRSSEEKYRQLVENIHEVIYSVDKAGIVTYISPAIQSMTGYSPSEIVGVHFSNFIHNDDFERIVDRYGEALAGQERPSEYRILTKSREARWVRTFSRPIREEGKTVGLQGVLSDVTAYKEAEANLQDREKDLSIKTKDLEEINTALRVLLKRREKDKEELEEKILLNLKELANPYLDKLKKSIDNKKERVYLDILEANLRTLTSSFSRDLHFKYLNLTPTELHIAGLVREGKTSKDIAEFMNLSSRTIESHRKNIRRKMGLTAKKRNLRTLLLEIE